ncbi:hypothetical protein [Streptomyces sp. NPDC048603]|uniref:hypothetical protein n=1 Tax=Streptomyces sp. NPDC048603 TaxID=3365577 RepID=UPI00371697F0
MAPSKSVDPDAAEKTALLDVYGAMTAAEVRTYQTAKLDPELSRYATHKALADIQSTLFWYQQKSTLMRGAPTHAPVVNKLVTAGDPLTAEITDCVDSTGYDKVHKDSGKLAAAPSGPRRHVVVSTAQRTRTGQWQIYTSSIERDRTC